MKVLDFYEKLGNQIHNRVFNADSQIFFRKDRSDFDYDEASPANFLIMRTEYFLYNDNKVNSDEADVDLIIDIYPS